MPKLRVLVRPSAAFVFCALFCLGATPAEQLPGPVAADVHESYRLLTSSFYNPVDPQALLAAAGDALADEAHKHGVTVVPPVLRVEAQTDMMMAELDNAIVEAADAAHAPPTDFAYAAIDAMARAVGDRYTQFFTPEEFRAFNDALDPERISGIGVMIVPDEASGSVRISYVVPATPADRAGLRTGDVLLAIDGSPAKGLSVESASKLLRGKAGTIASVVVARYGEPGSLTFSIRREEVQPPTVVFRMLPDDIGYIYVMAFGKATPSEFDTAVARLRDQRAKALVLDLRNDGGGYVDSALTISSRFIANRALVTIEERGQHATTIEAENDASIALPVSVLVNQYTASASEITAGALQDDGIGTLIGTRTFGKGVMQTLTPLPDGAAIKITTAHYLTPHHRDINLRGIDPDLRVEENRDARLGEVEHDLQLRTAMTLLQRKIAEAKP
ncbi:MAG: S41 family peptidase [Candidatus Eremiobacteraeota bacterium]|nr:S41 family peptidase [Candidatus Eremiobacteraeota bacterium]